MSPRPVLDAHSHAFPDSLAKDAIQALTKGAQWWDVHSYADATISGLLAAMSQAGIARSLLYSIATRPTQVEKITDWSALIAAPGIVPFASIHPDYQRPEQEVERIARLGLRGIKFHPQYMGCAVDDPRCIRIARAAAFRGLAMVLHAGHDPAFPRTDIASPRRIRRLHDAVPDLRLLASHLGGWQQWREALETIIGKEIYIDTSYSLGQCPDDVLASMLDRHPPTHVLFGTDSPWADSAVELDKFARLGMSEEHRHWALWENGHVFAGLPCEPVQTVGAS